MDLCVYGGTEWTRPYVLHAGSLLLSLSVGCAAHKRSIPVSLGGMCCTQVVYSRVSRWDVLHPGGLFPHFSVGCATHKRSTPTSLSGMCCTQVVYSSVSQWDVPHTGGLFPCLSAGVSHSLTSEWSCTAGIGADGTLMADDPAATKSLRGTVMGQTSAKDHGTRTSEACP